MKKRVWKIVGVAAALVVVVVAVAGFWLYNNLLHPSPQKSGEGEIEVACVGDSITFGQGVLMSRATDSYPAILSRLLGDEYTVVNYGLPIRTLLSTGNMPYFEEDTAQVSLASGAQIVIFMLGTNDSKPDNWDEDRFAKEYAEAIERYQAMDSNPDVYVMIPPRVFLDEVAGNKCNDEIVSEHIAGIIRTVAEEHGVEVIDLYAVTEDHPEWFGDGLHPDAEGNQAIAECIAEALTN